MKKILSTILLCVFALLMAFSVTACYESNWQGTTMKNWGDNVTSNGGFVAETDNYIYYINGSTSYGDDNTFGTPVKGSLMAAEKATLGTDNVKTEIVVPKLFVATDYKAGVYIYNDYVYYGTPSTDKNNSGEIARGELTFFKTKLDGTNTTKFFTVDQLSYDYRFIEVDGKVYLVYYDNVSFSLKCYDTVTKSTVVIAKTDAETKGKFESLDKYYFLTNEDTDGLVLLYTAKVYLDDYNKAEAESVGYERQEETFNKVYTFVPGDDIDSGNEFRGTCVLDGGVDGNEDGIPDDSTLYEVLLFNKDYLFYKSTDEQSKVKNWAVSVVNGVIDLATVQEVYNVDVLSDTAVIRSLDEVYASVNIVPSTGDAEKDQANAEYYIMKVSLLEKSARERVADVGMVTLLDVIEHGGVTYAYYINPMTKLARQQLVGQTADDFYKEQILSEDTIGSAWYKPEFITLNQGTAEVVYAMYLDNSAEGAAYVKYVKVYDSVTPVEVLEKDTDDDDVVDTYYIEGQLFLGKMNQADTVALAVNKLNAIPEVLEWEVEDDDVIVGKEVVEARKAYNALSSDAKKQYGESNLAKLQSAEKAVSAIKVLYKLDGIQNYEFEVDKQAGYRDAYNQAKIVMNTIDPIEDSEILAYIDNNLKWAYYEKGADLFK